ncbi:MAG: hypothetical protein KAT77_01425 [Nanoarchaeota archaeon]|nr:hypothetical protein [Nanoarchaeota archaeon]
MQEPDYKIKLGDVLFPFGGYVKYRMRHQIAIKLDHPDASLRSKCLFLYHTILSTAIAVGVYHLAEAALEKIINS